MTIAHESTYSRESTLRSGGGPIRISRLDSSLSPSPLKFRKQQTEALGEIDEDLFDSTLGEGLRGTPAPPKFVIKPEQPHPNQDVPNEEIITPYIIVNKTDMRLVVQRICSRGRAEAAGENQREYRTLLREGKHLEANMKKRKRVTS
mmetsp:Transcript_10931/g.16594  ORF Transcript_10931/g.16594 Transcript_10931/m.16594 type:complete len:147 (+) Transcript_10931:4844-5284(+)